MFAVGFGAAMGWDCAGEVGREGGFEVLVGGHQGVEVDFGVEKGALVESTEDALGFFVTVVLNGGCGVGSGIGISG